MVLGGPDSIIVVHMDPLRSMSRLQLTISSRGLAELPGTSKDIMKFEVYTWLHYLFF